MQCFRVSLVSRRSPGHGVNHRQAQTRPLHVTIVASNSVRIWGANQCRRTVGTSFSHAYCCQNKFAPLSVRRVPWARSASNASPNAWPSETTLQKGRATPASESVCGNDQGHNGDASGKQSRSNVAEHTSPWPLLRSLWPQDAAQNARIAFAFSGLIAGKALAIYAPLQLGHLIDSLGVGAEALPVGILAAYGLARLSTSFLNELRSALFATVSQDRCRALALRNFTHLHSLDVAFMLSSKPGALNVMLSRATQSLTQVLNMLLFNVLPMVVEFAMALAVMATIAGPYCALWSTATIATYVVFTTKFSGERRKLMRQRNKAEEEASGLFLDSLTNFEVVKYFQGEEREARRYDETVARVEAKQVDVLTSLAKLNFGQQFIVISGFTGVLAITSSHVLTGTLPVGDVVAVHGILAQLMQPLGILGGVYRVITQGFVDLGKVASFLERESVVALPPGGGAGFSFQGGQLELRNVHLSQSGKSVLSGASLTVPAGAKVALVGASGSGKSTILRLLYRLADPDKGQVLIDGQDVSQLDPATFRSHLGIVPQDCALFNDTVEYNIRYGRPGASQLELVSAANSAQLHDVLKELPDGYVTQVGERGLKLSGGERQRVGIARALLRNPSIVLLDEATSSLDVRTERHLVSAMEELMSGRTSVVVAHRLSTVLRCDTVAFLDAGTIVEHGTHQELMARSAKYRRFWQGSLSEVPA